MLCMAILFSLLANHWSRHPANSKKACQPGGGRWPLLIYCKGLCGYVKLDILISLPKRVLHRIEEYHTIMRFQSNTLLQDIYGFLHVCTPYTVNTYYNDVERMLFEDTKFV